MQSRSSLQVLYAVLILMVAQANCEEFMCYVCDDCSQITKDTPKEVCDESYFNKVETTPSPITTDITMTTDEITASPTEIITEPTSPKPTQTTKPSMPTAGTAGPPQNTTLLPTPPNPGNVAGPIDAVAADLNTTKISTTSISETTATTEFSNTDTTPETTFLKPVNLFMEPAQLRIRQLRFVSNPTVSYHCYLVQQTINGTLTTYRGCSRVNETEALCPQLESINNNTKFDKCTPCSNSLCNGSSAVSVSVLAVILGIVSAFLLGFPA